MIAGSNPSISIKIVGATSFSGTWAFKEVSNYQWLRDNIGGDTKVLFDGTAAMITSLSLLRVRTTPLHLTLQVVFKTISLLLALQQRQERVVNTSKNWRQDVLHATN